MPAAVALESTVISHGLPFPHNYETALRLEAVVREHHAQPQTIGVIQGKPVVGLSPEEIHHLAVSKEVRKLSIRDLPVAVARRLDGATTVASTMWLAHRHRIKVFATGGIGGIHRRQNPNDTFDISNDLHALSQVPMLVVCAGAKAILDLPATREALETLGITVVGFQTDTLPAFYSRDSGLPVDVRCDSPEEIAALYTAHQQLSLQGAILVTVPPPPELALPFDEVAPVIERALEDATLQNIKAAALTPFLLDRVAAYTDQRARTTNIALLEQNAVLAAKLACLLET